MDDIPTYRVTGSNIVMTNPKTIVDGLIVYPEAHIEINAKHMSQPFLQMLMSYLGDGSICVKMIKKVEE